MGVMVSRPEQVSPESIGVFVESDTWQRLMTLLALIRLQYRTEVGTDTSEMPDALARTIAWKEAAYDEELGIRVELAAPAVEDAGSWAEAFLTNASLQDLIGVIDGMGQDQALIKAMQGPAEPAGGEDDPETQAPDEAPVEEE